MTRSVPLPLEGGCTCRAVRYRLLAAPLFVHCCHCRWCQRETGSAFALNALFWLAIAVATPLFYCPGWCSSSAINTANVLNLIRGLLAGVALVYQLGQKKAAN